jgi:hypothetical protein
LRCYLSDEKSERIFASIVAATGGYSLWQIIKAIKQFNNPTIHLILRHAKNYRMCT